MPRWLPDTSLSNKELELEFDTPAAPGGSGLSAAGVSASKAESPVTELSLGEGRGWPAGEGSS